MDRKNRSETGYTAPHHLDRPLAKRIDGHFAQRVSLDKVVSISLVNTEPINDGSLPLSEHIDVMATMDFDCNKASAIGWTAASR